MTSQDQERNDQIDFHLDRQQIQQASSQDVAELNLGNLVQIYNQESLESAVLDQIKAASDQSTSHCFLNDKIVNDEGSIHVDCPTKSQDEAS